MPGIRDGGTITANTSAGVTSHPVGRIDLLVFQPPPLSDEFNQLHHQTYGCGTTVCD